MVAIYPETKNFDSLPDGALIPCKVVAQILGVHRATIWRWVQDGRLNTSFSGVDTKMSISFPGGVPIYVGEAQTVTYSLYTPVEPVYVLGSSKPNGFVRGQRTIAGSVIFTVFDRNVLLNAFYNAYHKSTDELPPFDIHLSFMNEYGISAALVIEGCSIPTEGQVHSVEDMITENTMQYVARDIKLMKPGDMT